MKDFVQGTDEYLIRAQDMVQQHIHRHGRAALGNDDTETEEEDATALYPEDHNMSFDNADTGHTARTPPTPSSDSYNSSMTTLAGLTLNPGPIG